MDPKLDDGMRTAGLKHAQQSIAIDKLQGKLEQVKSPPKRRLCGKSKLSVQRMIV